MNEQTREIKKRKNVSNTILYSISYFLHCPHFIFFCHFFHPILSFLFSFQFELNEQNDNASISVHLLFNYHFKVLSTIFSLWRLCLHFNCISLSFFLVLLRSILDFSLSFCLVSLLRSILEVPRLENFSNGKKLCLKRANRVTLIEFLL